MYVLADCSSGTNVLYFSLLHGTILTHLSWLTSDDRVCHSSSLTFDAQAFTITYARFLKRQYVTAIIPRQETITYHTCRHHNLVLQNNNQGDRLTPPSILPSLNLVLLFPFTVELFWFVRRFSLCSLSSHPFLYPEHNLVN